MIKAAIVTPPKIRRAVAADATGLAAFARRSFIDAYGQNNTPDHVSAYVNDAFDRQKVRTELEQEDTIYLFAHPTDEPEVPLGYAKLKFRSPIDCLSDDAPAQLERIYVNSKTQQRGIGGYLLTAVVDYARSGGAKTVWLAVWEENRKAQRFYERHRFAPVGRTFFMLGPERQRDIVMACSLS